MRALTLRRPWPWAILHCLPPKDVENRGWPLPEKHVGEWIALHAGKSFERPAFEAMLSGEFGKPAMHAPCGKTWSDTKALHPVGIVGLVRFGEPFEYDPEPVSVYAAAAFNEFAVPQPGDADYAEPALWAFGPWCWPILGRRILPEPVFCKGMLGLWTVPEDVEAQVNEQLEAA